MKIISLLLVLGALCLAHGTVTTITQNVRGFTFVSSTATTATPIRVSFVSLNTNLGSATIGTPTCTGGVAPCTFPVTNLDTGIYSVSDDSGATWKNATTDCLVPDVPAITLVTANSRTEADGDGRLLLRLRFAENHRYRSISYAFNGATGACNSGINNLVAGTKQLWNRTNTATSCTAPRMDYTQDFNNALTICNFQRDESDATNTVFSATVLITTIDTGDVIRGTRYERTLQTSVTIRIAFQTNVTAQTSAMQIYGSRITDSTITAQTWNPSTFVATLTLFTSVQYPYMFRAPVFTTTEAGFNAPTIVAQTNDPNNDALNNGANQPNRAQCTTTSPSTPSTAGQVCNQYWTITLSRSTGCTGSNQLNLAGSWGIRFDITCPNYYPGACNAPDPKNDSISFTTNSDNYCPVLISTQAASASLTVYQASALTGVQSQFVFGTFSYFSAVVTAPILMDHVAVESVFVTSGASTFLGSSALYNRAFSNAATWFGVSTTTATLYPLLNGVRANDAASTSPAMTVTDNHDGAAAALSKRAVVAWRWNALTSAASGDNPTTTIVQVNLRIRYRNQSTVSMPDERITLTKHYHHILNTDVQSTSASVGITAGTVTPAGPSGNAGATASSSSVGLALSVVGIAAGVVGIIALVSVFTVYMLRRQRERSKEQMASIQLSSTTDLTASA